MLVFVRSFSYTPDAGSDNEELFVHSLCWFSLVSGSSHIPTVFKGELT